MGWQLQGQTQPCWQQQALCRPTREIAALATNNVGERVAKIVTQQPRGSLLRCKRPKPVLVAADTVQQEVWAVCDAPSRCRAEAVLLRQA